MKGNMKILTIRSLNRPNMFKQVLFFSDRSGTMEVVFAPSPSLWADHVDVESQCTIHRDIPRPRPVAKPHMDELSSIPMMK